MHNKSDCRLRWRVAAYMFIVAVAMGAGGRSTTSVFLKLRSLYGGHADGILGIHSPPFLLYINLLWKNYSIAPLEALQLLL